jgi:hypothetical protein
VKVLSFVDDSYKKISSGNGMIYSSDVAITTREIKLVFDKMYTSLGDSPYIIGVVGNETEGFVICSHISPQFG